MSEFEKLPVTVLSGFLGAGKTTLLNHILSNRDLLTSLFDAALLSRSEMERGPRGWARLEDSFPHWGPRQDAA